MSLGVILVVEDDDAIRRGVVDMLRYNGYRVHEAADGRRGLDLALSVGAPLIGLKDSGGARIQEGVAALELNISCPNIKEGGIQFGCSLTGTYDVVSAVRKVTRLPIIPKLTPNVTDVASFARAAEEGGADAVSLVNTFLALAIDVETRTPLLSNGMGGLSGPAIRPIAVRMVHECRQAVSLPIIGMGGIRSAADALEFIIAGATAVQVGTANFVDPFLWQGLESGVDAYLDRHGFARVEDLVGRLRLPGQEHT